MINLNKFKKEVLFTLILAFFFACSIEINNSENVNNEEEQQEYLLPTNVNLATEGLLDEYVNITGENLLLDSLRFKFDNIIASAFQPNSDTIKVRVPRALERYNPDFTMSTFSSDSLIASGPFQLKAPIISHPEEEIVKFSEYVWIYGENFDYDLNSINVTLNNVEVQISEATHDSIQIVIPNNVGSQILDLKIFAQLQEVSVNNIMQLETPTITNAPGSTQVGSAITLIGNNFNPDQELGTFRINNEIDAYIDYIYNTDSLRLRVPFGPYEDFEIYKIEYETSGMQSEYNNTIIITSDFVFYTKNNPININSNVYSYNNYSYVLGNDDDEVNGIPEIFLYQLNHSSRTWNKIESVSYVSYSSSVAFHENGNLYVFAPRTNESEENKIHEINLNNFSIEEINSPPNNNLFRISPAIFIKDNLLYLGKGRSGYGISDPFYTDLYSYDSITGLWNTLSTDSSEFYGSTSYTYQGNTYISTYVIGTWPIYDFRLFNPINNNFEIVTPSSTFQTRNVFHFQNSLLRASLIASTNEVYFYNYDDIALLDKITVSQLEGASNFFSIDDKVLFYSGIINNIYAPSSGFYLINPNISENF